MSETQNIADEKPPRPTLPPVERSETHGLVAPAFAPAAPEKEGNWFHRNRWFTKEPISYTGYQFTRSILAALPYGPAMALGHHLFGLASVKGQKMGLTEEGIRHFNEFKNVPALEKAAAEAAKTGVEFYQKGSKAVVGRNMMRVANSPLNAAVQIALGFTMFRFVGGVVKNLRDRVMNENNSAADTEREVRNAPHTVLETVKSNWAAESTGTPIAALVLGFMSAVHAPIAKLWTRDKAQHPGLKGYGEQVKKAWSPESKLLQNAAVWTFSYSLFFLLAESLFKDVQLKRGMWKGHPNSLKNGPDDTVGGPGAIDYVAPEERKALYKSAEEGYKPTDDKAKDSEHPLRYPVLTGEPSLGRFMIRRVLPVAVGISGYAMMKRATYLGVGGPMKALTVEASKGLKTFGDHAKFLGKNAWREGAATATFGVLWMATDAWGTWYDKTVHKLQDGGKDRPLSEHQSQKLSELHQQLVAKETSSGRAA